MITFNQFKNEMAWVTGNFTNDQLKIIYNAVDSCSFDTIETLYQYYNENDFTIFIDTNLDTLINDCLYNGISIDDIIKYINNVYGVCIDLYYLKDNNVYALTFGVC